MLREALVNYKKHCEAEQRSYSRLLSMFSLQHNYPAKIAAITKLLLELDLVDVQYSKRDVDVLCQGKLATLLEQHSKELPTRFSYERKFRDEHCANAVTSNMF